MAKTPKKPPGKTCNARTKGRKGGYCQQPAGWGTPHPGTGRCKLHGGCSPHNSPGTIVQRTHGIYDSGLTEEEQALRPELLTMQVDDELAMTRIRIRRLVRVLLAQDQALAPEDQERLLELAEKEVEGRGEKAIPISTRKKFRRPDLDLKLFQWTGRLNTLLATKMALEEHTRKGQADETAEKIRAALREARAMTIPESRQGIGSTQPDPDAPVDPA